MWDLNCVECLQAFFNFQKKNKVIQGGQLLSTWHLNFNYQASNPRWPRSFTTVGLEMCGEHMSIIELKKNYKNTKSRYREINKK